MVKFSDIIMVIILAESGDADKAKEAVRLWKKLLKESK